MRGTSVAVAAMCAWAVFVASATIAVAAPPGRHYEMVSPMYKAGYGVTGLNAVAPSGEAAMFESLGAFAGATAGEVIGSGRGTAYMARRGVGGWQTLPLVGPASLTPNSGTPGALSATLERSVISGSLAAAQSVARFENPATGVWLHDTAEPDLPEYFEPIATILGETGRRVGISGASAYLSHVAVSSDQALTPEAQGIPGTTITTYDLPSDGNGQLRLIGLNNEMPPERVSANCRADVGNIIVGRQASKLGALALDGNEIFFSTGMTGVGDACEHVQVFVTLARERTIEVSKPVAETCVEVPCGGAPNRANAEFVGASEDGTEAFFVAPLQAGQRPLVPGQTDRSNNLYLATIGCEESKPDCGIAGRDVTNLSDVSHSAGEEADVRGMVALAQDGSRVYFVAKGVLGGLNSEGLTPVAGAANLYVYDVAKGDVKFIVDLCSNGERSGNVEDPECPASLTESVNDERMLWSSAAPRAEATANARFLVFTSFGRLTADDTDNASDVYRYDAESGRLVRVTTGEHGADSNGNRDDTSFDQAGRGDADAEIHTQGLSSAEPATEYGLRSRAISEDGSRIVFTTRAPLSQAATNGQINAYEWHDGSVSLVSSGSDEEGVEEAVITPSGDDIIFVTVQHLLSQDKDEVADVYDARIGAGFPPLPAEEQPCADEACQGPLTNPAPLVLPGSLSQPPGENISSTRKVSKRHNASRVRKKKGRRGAKRARRHARHGIKTRGNGGKR